MGATAEFRMTGLKRRTSGTTVFMAIWLGVTAQQAEANWLKLSDGPSTSDVIEFKISPDENWVVYRSNADDPNIFELYSVSVFGGTSVRLNLPLSSGQSLANFEIDPTSRYVVYRATQNSVGVQELFSVAIGGGVPARLNGDLPDGADVEFFQISPDGARVVYRADQEINNLIELFSTPITGGAQTRISHRSGLGVDSVLSSAISPDSSKVVYKIDQAVFVPPGGDPRDDIALFSVPITGGGATRLNDFLALFETRREVRLFRVTPDSTKVVYTEEVDTTAPLISVIRHFAVASITGGSPTTLSSPAGAGVLTIPSFEISPDSARVVFRGDHRTEGLLELFSTALAIAPTARLNGDLVAGGGIFSYAIAPDSGRVVYRGDQDTFGIAELFSAPIDGGGANKLNAGLAADQDVLGFEIGGDSSLVAYCATDGFASIPVGHRVPLAGPAASGEVIWAGQILAVDACDFGLEPSGAHAVVRGSLLFNDSILRLWQVVFLGTPVLAGEELIPVGDFQPDGDVAWPPLILGSPFQIGSLGTVVYVADQQNGEKFELFSIPMFIFRDGFESGDTTVWSATSGGSPP